MGVPPFVVNVSFPLAPSYDAPSVLHSLSLKSFSDVSAGAALSQPTGAWLDRLFCRQGIWAF